MTAEEYNKFYKFHELLDKCKFGIVTYSDDKSICIYNSTNENSRTIIFTSETIEECIAFLKGVCYSNRNSSE